MNAKKLCTMMVLVMFMLSMVPAVMAQNTATTQKPLVREKCGVNSFRVHDECDGGFREAYWQCHDGSEKEEGGDTSCKSSETWRNYAERSCKGRCLKRATGVAVRDLREDVRDRREDVYDRSQQDMRDCLKKCKEADGVDCRKRCKIRDLKEDVRDRREDRRDAVTGVERIRKVKVGKNVPILSDKEKEKYNILVKERRTRYKALPALRTEIKKIQDDPTKKELLEKKRRNMQEELFKARNEYKLAKKKYLEIRSEFTEHRKIIRERKKELRECAGSDSDECRDLRKDTRKKAKPFLLKTADMILEKLYEIRARIVAESEEMEDVEDTLADLDSAIDEIENAKSVLGNLNDESSREEVKEAANTIKKAWKKVKVKAKRAVGKVGYRKVHTAVKKMSGLAVKFSKITEALDKQGKDVTELKGLVEDYTDKVSEAREALGLAKDGYKASGDVVEGFKEAHGHLKVAHKKVLAAHQLIKKIVGEMRELRGQKLLTTPLDDDEGVALNTPTESDDLDDDEEDDLDDEDEDEEPITGDALEMATAAALEHIGEGKVTETEVDDEESKYQVEITLDNGDKVDVHLDENFNVISTEYEDDDEDDLDEDEGDLDDDEDDMDEEDDDEEDE